MKLKRYNLTEYDFERFRALINRTSGIYFDRGKMDLLRLGLAERAEVVGAEDLGDYYEMLTSDPQRENELRQLLGHLSVQETHFFRNLPQFDALRKYVIPEIARRKAAGNRVLKFWSAGCSTGQEPYSIAMSVHDVLPDPGSWEVQILATDLNDHALEVAARGWYPESKITGLDRDHLNRYFIERDDGYQARDFLREMISFSRHNMVTDSLPIELFGTCDVIFCRNVIIYFTHQTAKHVIELFFDILNPGGYLFLGHSETLWKMSAKYSLVEMGDAFIYKKSLPRAIDGRRFIADRRMRDMPLPPGVQKDRRKSHDRRGEPVTDDLLIRGSKPAIPEPEHENPAAPQPAGARDEIRETCGKARNMIDLGEHSKAIEMLSDAVNGTSTDCESYFLLGLAYQKLGQSDEAAEAFRKAIYCNDSHSLAYFHLANVLEDQGFLQQAVKEYRNASRSLAADPPDSWEQDLEAFDIQSLVDLCQWKIENLGSVEN
ncbi:MAG: tetratricopeptide repeat protein [Gaiellales bacterium]|nr:MAG: tetratricopeptide repeat protein [Gaiellales bacterium]